MAVLPIVAFHLGFQHIPGGFVGVDIFFVISGYLIGGIILREWREGRFSLARFYERRLRRILPALVAMLVATTLACGGILFPKPLVDYAGSLVAAILSVSNIYFWSATGYFDSAAVSKPLLHIWSLGVEEQFYLLFPPLVFAIRWTRFPLSWSLGIVALVSLAVSIVGVRYFPNATFYLLPTRAWELLLGVLCAELRLPVLERRAGRESVALLGGGMVAAAMLLYSAATPFPGIAAVPPCLGTAMLLVSGAHGRTWVGRALSLRPVVFFGLISYSLYLWHWPVIVLLQQTIPEGFLRLPERGAALLLSVALAWGSWRFVERPFRAPRIGARTIFITSGAAATIVAALGGLILIDRGLPQRFPDAVVRVADYIDDAHRPEPHNCVIGLHAQADTALDPACLAVDASRPTVLIFGDSHADQLHYGLVRRFPGIHFQQATAAGCRTSLAGAPDETATCHAFRRWMFERYLPEHRPKWVLLANFWGVEGQPQLDATLDWFRGHGIGVILAGPVPRYEVPLPLVMALSDLRHSRRPIERAFIPHIDALDRSLAGIAKAHGVPYFSAYAILCGTAPCRTAAPDGAPVQFDYGHLTGAGSLIVASGFPRALMLASGAAARP